MSEITRVNQHRDEIIRLSYCDYWQKNLPSTLAIPTSNKDYCDYWQKNLPSTLAIPTSNKDRRQVSEK